VTSQAVLVLTNSAAKMNDHSPKPTPPFPLQRNAAPTVAGLARRGSRERHDEDGIKPTLRVFMVSLRGRLLLTLQSIRY
jgi:hypothetical protein